MFNDFFKALFDNILINEDYRMLYFLPHCALKIEKAKEELNKPHIYDLCKKLIET